MDSIFSKFSLQTFLRQFFCGVVFFCPFLLYAFDWCNVYLGENELSVAASKDGFTFSLQYGTWATGKLMVVGIIACIIGTVIYHLEKNLYSYLIQALLEVAHTKTINGKASGVIAFCFFIVALILLVTFVWAKSFTLFVLVLLLFIFIGASLSNGFSLVISRTQKSWIIEGCKTVKNKADDEAPKEDDGSSYKMAHSIADKVATWSDFIHCVQSCCFAWIAGSCFVKHVLKTNIDITYGNSIAVSLLLLELIFDCHRYQHVIDMTEDSFSKPDLKSK